MMKKPLNRPKYKNLHLKLLRDVKSDYMSSISIVLLIAIGIGAYSAPVAGWIGLSDNIEQVYEKYNFEDVHVEFFQPVSRSSLERILSSVDETILNQIWVNMRLVIEASFLLKNSANEIVHKIQLRLIGVNLTERFLSLQDPDTFRFINDIFIFNGEMLDVGDIGTTNIILDSRLAAEYQLSIADKISVRLPSDLDTEVQLKIKGLGSNPEYIVPLSSMNDLPASSKRFGVAFISLRSLQVISDSRDEVNDLIISLKDDAKMSRSQLAEYFKTFFEDRGMLILPPYTREDQQSNYILWLDIRAVNRIGTRYPFYLLIIGSFGVYLLLSRRVKHQKRFIGLALASGYSRRDIFMHYLEYAYLLGSLGIMLGIGGGWILSQFVIRLYSHRLAIPTLSTIFPLELLLISVPIGLLSMTMAAFLPARSATRLTPRECLMDSPHLTIKVSKKSSFERLILVFFPNISMGTKMSMRNIRRHSGRTISAFLSICLALSLLVSTRAFLDSGYYTVDLYYGAQGVKWDARIQFYESNLVSEDILDELLAIDGIDGVEFTFEIPSSVSGLNVSESRSMGYLDVFSLLKLPEPQSDFINQREGFNRSITGLYLIITSYNASLTRPYLIKGNFSASGIVISEQFALNHDYELGETINITIPKVVWGSISGFEIPIGFIQRNVSLVITGFSRDFTSFMGYLDAGLFRILSDWRDLPLYNRAYLAISPDVDKVSLKKTIYQAFPQIKIFEYQEELQEGFQEVLNLMNVVVTVMSFFSTLLGLVLISSVLLVSIIERQREISTMEVLGASRRLILRILLLEYLIIGVLGIVMGLALGQVVGKYFFDLIGTELFHSIYHVSNFTYGLGIISTIFMITVAVFSVSYLVFRQPLAESTKTFS